MYDSFIQKLPKVELHAHLNGCVRGSTLRELSPDVPLPTANKISLPEVFTYFEAVTQVTTELSHVRRITHEAIEDFVGDGVIYLELRTTPKHRSECGVTKMSYMKAVLEGRQAFAQKNRDSEIIVRFLLTIDRRESSQSAMETVELAQQLKSEGVVGVDLAGDPLKGAFGDWKEALVKAREAGLKLTFHAGELRDDPETAELVRFHPDRLGHMCFPTKAVEQEMYHSDIPVEICLTSNLLTKSVEALGRHHLVEYYRQGHPVAICTDDPGTFCTSLSREYSLAAEILELDPVGILNLAAGAVEFAFCDEDTKMKLREIFIRFKGETLS